MLLKQQPGVPMLSALPAGFSRPQTLSITLLVTMAVLLAETPMSTLLRLGLSVERHLLCM